MMTRGNSQRGSDATPWRSRRVASAVAAVLGLCAGAGPAAGQDGARAPLLVDTAGAIDLRPPSPELTLAAFAYVRARVAEAAGGAPAGTPPTVRCTGASVVLRLGGRIVGRGESTAGSGEDLRLATDAAIEELGRRAPQAADAAQEAAALAELARATASLELAGTLVPIAPGTYEDADAELAPGLDGVAARFGGRLAMVFPGAALRLGLTPGDALGSAVAIASEDPSLGIRSAPEAQPRALAAARDAVFYRFRTTHAAQLAPGRSPTFLVRGGRIVAPRELTGPALRAWAGRMADHLARRAASPAATPLERAVAALALAEHAGTLGTGAGPAGAAARGLLRGLTTLDEGKADAWSDATTAAGTLAALHAIERVAPGEVMIDAAARARLRSRVADAYDPAAGWSGTLPEGGRPLVALGLVLSAMDEPGDANAAFAARAEAEGAVRSIYKETPPGRLVSQMPWLGRAELELAGPAGRIGAATALREMRDQLWAHQLTPEDAGADAPDLAGGIVFTAARTPLPTWQSARPVAFAATMLGDPRLTDAGEMWRELSRLLASLRFLRQLTADEHSAWMTDDPETAQGGVRASLWDARQPIEATALTLLAVSDTIRALDRLSAAVPAASEKP